MKIFIIDKNDISYLRYFTDCLKRQGIDCELEERIFKVPKKGIKAANFKIVNDKGQDILIECEIGTLDLSRATQQINEWEESIKNCSYIISIIPVKWFSALRYNIDEQWDGIETWILPREYKRILSAKSTTQKMIWVFQGMENLGPMGGFFTPKDNNLALNTFWDNNIRKKWDEKNARLQEVVKEFLKVIDEPRFYENASENLFFGFNSLCPINCKIGEKTREFWCLYSMDKILKTVELTL